MAGTKRNVVLTRLPNPSLRHITPPLGLGFLLEALKEVESVTPVLIDRHLEAESDGEFIRRVQELEPLAVGVQVFCVDYALFSELLPRLKQALPDTFLIAGGPHPTVLPQLTLEQNPDVDVVVCGEGEVALPRLVRALLEDRLESELERIPNLAYRHDGEFRQTAQEFIDVQRFDRPAWDLLQPRRYPAVQHGTFHKSTKVVPILTSRGCPYPCTFCAGHLTTGKKIRRRRPQDVVDEIEFLKREYGFEEFIIEDENFTFYKEHVLAIAGEIKRRGIDSYFSLPGGIRLDRIDEEIVRHLSEMGTYLTALGIESISPSTLRRMRKRWSREQVDERVRLLKRHGIMVQASFILGFRDDTLADIEETIDFALQLDVDQAYFGNYLPLPGTEDFEVLVDRGDLVLEDIDWKEYVTYGGHYPYHPRDVSAEELHRAIKRATLRFYLRPRILLGFLSRLRSPTLVRSFLSRASRLFLRRAPLSKHRP